MRFYRHASEDARMATMPTRIPSMFEQLMAAAAAAAHPEVEVAQKQPWHFQPGARPGATTDRVLAELARVAPQALEHGQLRARCGASRGAVSWAIHYLQHQDKIEGVPDRRNPQYRRWRIKQNGEAK
jgi:hypothetical protein